MSDSKLGQKQVQDKLFKWKKIRKVSKNNRDIKKPIEGLPVANIRNSLRKKINNRVTDYNLWNNNNS